MDYDIFISHASEDKDSVARPLALALKQLGYSIWYDEFTLKLGDSLRRSIDAGLARSRFGVVVLSPAFLQKNWPQYELDGLVQRENIQGQKVILPVWHNIDCIAVAAYSPSLADRVAASSAAGINVVADKIADALGPAYGGQLEKPLTVSSTSRMEDGALIIQRRQESPVSYPVDHAKAARQHGRVEGAPQFKKHDTLDSSGDDLKGCLYVYGIGILSITAWAPVLIIADKLGLQERLGIFGYIINFILIILSFVIPTHFLQKAGEKWTEK